MNGAAFRNPAISEHEMGVLRLLETLGGAYAIQGPRIGAAVKQAARDCVRKGYLTGTPKMYSLTDAGRSLLAQDRETIHPHA
jgi:hypothetical protein